MQSLRVVQGERSESDVIKLFIVFITMYYYLLLKKIIILPKRLINKNNNLYELQSNY